ncbi:DUF1579 domain-containing protein [Chitinimonas naiadis]
MNEKAQAEHLWLARMIGDWEYVSECDMGPDEPATVMKGKETVRPFGELWVVGDGVCEAGEGSWRSTITLGYNLAEKRFVGTFVADMMTHLWIYSGSLDTTTDTLTLDAEGPDFTTGKTVRYQDIVQQLGADKRTLSSRVLKEDGTWVNIMRASYQRKG